MARPRRTDYEGAWLHVGNRGLAQRTIYESDSEMRFFLLLLACKVRAGEIEVHAYCLLPNHFHLLVRSPCGQLSRAMQGIQDKYAWRFNRKRDRDGALFRGRFWSKVIHGIAYRVKVFQYIDQNPVHAGLAARPRDYEFGSAYHFAQSVRPPWLSQRFGDELLANRVRIGGGGSGSSEEDRRRTRELIDRLVDGSSPCIRELDDLLVGTSQRTKNWMVRRARMADGVPPGLVLAHPDTVRELIEGERSARPDLQVRVTRKRESAWQLLEPGLLRTVCGLTIREVAECLYQHQQTISKRIQRHRRAIQVDDGYAAAAARVFRRALRHDWRM